MAAGRIKGITVEIDGNTTKLTDSLKKVDTQLKDTQGQLRDVNKLLKLDPSNVDLLKQKQQLLKKAVEDTKDRQEQLKKALEESKKAGNTEENQRQQDALQRELIETTEKLKDLQKEYGKCSPQLEAISAKTGQWAEQTRGLSMAAGAAAGGMLAMAYSAGKSADDLLTMSNVTGFSVEELQKLQYAQDFVDVSFETMTGSIQKLTKQMTSGSDSFEKLGVQVKNADGTFRNAKDVWYDTIAALGQIENETERDKVSMDIFGKSAMEMAGIVDDGGAALKSLGEEAEATGNILSGEAVEDAVKFNDQIDELKAKAQQAFLAAGASLADTLVPALERLVDVISTVLSWFGSLDGSTQAFILTILGLVAAISPVLGLISTLTGLAAGLNVAMLPMIGTIGAIVIAIGAAVAAGVWLYQNWDTIKKKAGDLYNSIKEKFQAIKNTIKEKIDAAKDAVKSAIDKIKGFFNFSWSLPKLKMPHFSIKGSFSLAPPSVPKLSVDWYAKAMNAPMLLDGATIFGAMNGKLLGGGEAGKEVIVGLDRFRDYAGSNYDINITVNAAQGQSETEIARMVARQLQTEVMRKKAVWG